MQQLAPVGPRALVAAPAAARGEFSAQPCSLQVVGEAVLPPVLQSLPSLRSSRPCRFRTARVLWACSCERYQRPEPCTIGAGMSFSNANTASQRSVVPSRRASRPRQASPSYSLGVAGRPAFLSTRRARLGQPVRPLPRQERGIALAPPVGAARRRARRGRAAGGEIDRCRRHLRRRLGVGHDSALSELAADAPPAREGGAFGPVGCVVSAPPAPGSAVLQVAHISTPSRGTGAWLVSPRSPGNGAPCGPHAKGPLPDFLGGFGGSRRPALAIRACGSRRRPQLPRGQVIRDISYWAACSGVVRFMCFASKHCVSVSVCCRRSWADSRGWRSRTKVWRLSRWLRRTATSFHHRGPSH